MELTRSLGTNGNLEPVALDYLGNIPNELLHHAVHRLRHPWSIYSNSLLQVFASFTNAIERYSEIISGLPAQNDTGRFLLLMNAYKDLLYCLREHIDDCYLIFKTLVPQQPKAVRFQTQFLKNAGFLQLALFEDRIAWYKSHLSPLVNTLKHHQGRLRWLYFHNSTEVRPGYYLEELGDDGAVGPSQSVHGGDTAFSFARDLKIHLSAVYFISQSVVDVVRQKLKEFDVELPAKNPGKLKDFEHVLTFIAEISLSVFPNELRLPCSIIELTNTGSDRVFRVRYPAEVPDQNFPVPMKISGVPMYADQFTSIFRLPYWRRSDIPRV